MVAHTLQPYQQASERAAHWLLSHLEKDGSYGSTIQDLASYYKSPYLFYLSGRVEEASQLLTYIQRHFMRNNGDFVTADHLKSENPALAEYWAYMNGWLALTAQKLGRFEVSYPAYQYLTTFYHPTLGGFITQKPAAQTPPTVDVLSTAHLGLTALYFGDLDKAKRAGDLLQTFAALQPDSQQGFYLRLDNEGRLLTAFPPEASLFFTVSAVQPNQAYFMVGYPAAFLGKLYQATGHPPYLDTAKSYLEFALSCRDHLRTCPWSHKVAWGAAIVAHLTRERRWAELAESIADSLLSHQEADGSWWPAQPAPTSFDQTAEIAIWLREITAELST